MQTRIFFKGSETVVDYQGGVWMDGGGLGDH